MSVILHNSSSPNFHRPAPLQKAMSNPRPHKYSFSYF